MIFETLRKSVVDTGLCSFCGTCVGVCPAFCIDMDENCEPQLFGECTDCGLCLKFCPAIDFDFKRFRVIDEKVKMDPFIGGYQSIYFGCTTDQQIRNKASGGGIVSALLISALEKGLIDGAVVVKMDEEKIGQTKVVIAENRDEVLEAAQSKYISAPVNTILGKIKSRKGELALVGLPCHVHAIRKLQAYGPKGYSNKIKYVIGLFCGSSLNNNFIDYIVHFLGLQKADVQKIHFRHRRHPTVSSLLITTKDGRRIFVDRRDYSFLFHLFAREACQYCIDHTNEFADISIGDMRPFPTYSPNYVAVEPLQSVIIIRTKKGAELFKNADNIDFFRYDVQDLVVSKLTNMVDKKFCSYTRMHLRRGRGLPIPRFNQDLTGNYLLPNYKIEICPSKAFTASKYFSEFLWLKIMKLIQSKVGAKLVSKMPPQLLKAAIRRYLRFKTRGLLHKVQ